MDARTARVDPLSQQRDIRMSQTHDARLSQTHDARVSQTHDTRLSQTHDTRVSQPADTVPFTRNGPRAQGGLRHPQVPTTACARRGSGARCS